jgi:pantothenate kinase type III
MKRTIIAGSTLLISSLVCGNVAAEIEGVSGANLKKICESYLYIPSNTAEGMCLGYVVGVMSVMEYINVVCRPVKSTHSQAALVVQKYLADHPEKLHINADELVLDALQQAFPCTELHPGR